MAGMSSTDIQEPGVEGENMQGSHGYLPMLHFFGGKTRRNVRCIGVKCSKIPDSAKRNRMLFNENRRRWAKCKIIRLTIGVQALILRATHSTNGETAQNEEHFRFCILLLLYYPVIVRLICDAAKRNS